MTERVPFEGREEVTALHRDIFAVLENLETTEPLALGDTRSFSFRARVRGVELEAHVLLHVNADGLIDDLTIFIRPLPALATLFAALPPRVSARRRGRPTGAVAVVLTWPIGFSRKVPSDLHKRAVGTSGRRWLQPIPVGLLADFLRTDAGPSRARITSAHKVLRCWLPGFGGQ
jgi:hypothetical protein